MQDTRNETETITLLQILAADSHKPREQAELKLEFRWDKSPAPSLGYTDLTAPQVIGT